MGSIFYWRPVVSRFDCLYNPLGGYELDELEALLKKLGYQLENKIYLGFKMPLPKRCLEFEIPLRKYT